MVQKILTVSAAALFVVCRAFSQNADTTSVDVITRTDGTLLKGKVIQVSQAAIEIDPAGDIPFMIVKRMDVASIKYSNGSVVDMAPIKAGAPGGAPALQTYQIKYTEPGIAGRLLSGEKITMKSLTAESVSSAGKSDKDRARSLETKYVFVDSKGMTRELKLVGERTGGIWSNFKANFYVDGTLEETKFDKLTTSTYQWINSTIPGERFLLTAMEYTYNSGSRDIICAIDRLDGPPNDSDKMKRLAEVRTNTTTRPMIVMDESFDLSSTLFSAYGSSRNVIYFRQDETFYLGKDNVLHRLRVESEYNSPVLSARVYVDNKLLKERSTDILDGRELNLTFGFETPANDRFDLTINQLLKQEYTRRTIVKLLD